MEYLLFLLVGVAVALSSYTAFGVFRLTQVVEQMCDRLEEALAPQVFHSPPNARQGEIPEELRMRGL